MTAPQEVEGRVLLQTSPEAAEAIVERLNAEGVHAEIVDRPGFLALLFAFGTYRVRIGVPVDELEAAREVMARWEPEAKANVHALARVVQRQFLLATLPALLVVGTSWVLSGTVRPAVLAAALLAWLVAFLALAARERRRQG